MTLTTEIADAFECARSDPQVLAEIAVKVMQERQVSRDELIEKFNQLKTYSPNFNASLTGMRENAGGRYLEKSAVDAILSARPTLGFDHVVGDNNMMQERQAEGFDGEKYAEKWAEPYYQDCGNMSYDPSTGQSDCSAKGDCSCAFRHEIVEEVAQEIYNLGYTAGHAAQVNVRGFVKELVWECDIAYSWEASVPYSSYDIRLYEGIYRLSHTVVTDTYCFPEKYKTLNEAKAAAQAHHKALVLLHIEGE